MTNMLQKFCEENAIECVVKEGPDEPATIEMYHRPSGRSFIDKRPFLSDAFIKTTIEKAKYMFYLVDIPSYYPTIPIEDIIEQNHKLRKRLTESTKQNRRPKIRKVIFNDPTTIVFWSDGSKTVVKANNEKFDAEKGLAMAISKKFLGNKGDYYETFKKYLPKGENNDI